jgi:hypothetical protein
MFFVFFGSSPSANFHPVLRPKFQCSEALSRLNGKKIAVGGLHNL